VPPEGLPAVNVKGAAFSHTGNIPLNTTLGPATTCMLTVVEFWQPPVPVTVYVIGKVPIPVIDGSKEEPLTPGPL